MVSTWKSVGVSGFHLLPRCFSLRERLRWSSPQKQRLPMIGPLNDTEWASMTSHRCDCLSPGMALRSCPSHCIGSPSEALGRRPYNLYAIRRRWKKNWVSTDPLPRKPTRPISIYIYIPRSRPVSTFLSEGNEVVRLTIKSFSWFHNMLKELLHRLNIPYTLPEIKHG